MRKPKNKRKNPKTHVALTNKNIASEKEAISNENIIDSNAKSNLQIHRKENEDAFLMKPNNNLTSCEISSSDGSKLSDTFSTDLQLSEDKGFDLPQGTKDEMAHKFGEDFSKVKIHNDEEAIQMSRSLNAHAFTHGNHIYFNQGQYKPESISGKKLLAHELTHVVQQSNSSGNDSGIIQMSLMQPLEKKAKKGTMTISQFIDLIVKEENKYPKHEQTNAKLMITRLRKIFYGSSSWDKYLIKGVDDISSPYGKPKVRERSRKRVEAPGLFNEFDLVDKETYPVDNQTLKRPKIYQNQEVALEKGNEKGMLIDIGHVLAGLDAYNHKHNVYPSSLLTVGIDSNMDAVTWVGDLGSALAEIHIKYYNNNNSINKKQIQNIINEYASAQDMLGNIDAYVIANKYHVAGGQKVSDILKDYYLGKGVKRNQNKRYSTFAKIIGLKGWDGTKFKNEKAWITKYADQVNDAAALYVGAGGQSATGIAPRLFAISMSRSHYAKYLVKFFLIALKRQIKNE